MAPSPASGRRMTATRERRSGAVQWPGCSRSRVRPAAITTRRGSSSAARRSNTSPSSRSASSTSTNRDLSLGSRTRGRPPVETCQRCRGRESGQQQQRAPRRGNCVDVDAGLGGERATGDVGERRRLAGAGIAQHEPAGRCRQLQCRRLQRTGVDADRQAPSDRRRAGLPLLPNSATATRSGVRATTAGPCAASGRLRRCATAAVRSEIHPIWISTRSGSVIARPAACSGIRPGSMPRDR